VHEYAFDTELVRLAILLGVVVSMLYYERYGVTTGGAIVPGYLALFIARPTQIAATYLVATITYWIVQKHLRPRWMLWGRRLFESEILVSLVLQSISVGFLLIAVSYFPQVALLIGIGFLLPGIIAHDMGRQGVRTTIWASLVCTLIVFGIVILIGAVRDMVGYSFSLSAIEYQPLKNIYAYPSEWLLLAIVLSVLTSIALYHGGFFKQTLLPNSLRTGGFVTAGYLALFVTRPLDLLFVVFCATVSYLIVTKYLMKKAILFGRSKLAIMVLTGMAITWLVEIIITLSESTYVPWLGFGAITPTVVALLANDAQRQGPIQTLLGSGLSTLIVFVLMTILYYGYTLLVG
jgi:poly-gamma-glutamate biosynthesis protein PgsC/CapC